MAPPYTQPSPVVPGRRGGEGGGRVQQLAVRLSLIGRWAELSPRTTNGNEALGGSCCRDALPDGCRRTFLRRRPLNFYTPRVCVSVCVCLCVCGYNLRAI